jgi:hypothetical protein
MYSLAVAVLLAAVIACYAVADDERVPVPPPRTAEALAQDLGVYRQAVLDYALVHPGTHGAVANAHLPFPAWYTTPNPLWRNYVWNGTVVAYAAAMPSVDIVGAIVALSGYSLFAGQTLQGAVVPNGYTGSNPSAVGVALPATLTIANGLPVWMGQAY